MGKRNYSQYCPLAYAMDVVGERWTLLIIRELMFGPRRFTDLQRGLPGIGTNLLSLRLKELEQRKLLRQRVLPPPAAATVYELDQLGYELAPAIRELSIWGMRYLCLPIPKQHHIGKVQSMFALMNSFLPADSDATLTIEFFDPYDAFYATISNRELLLQHGAAPQQPDAVVKTEWRSIVSIAGHQPDVYTALEQGLLNVTEGEADAVKRFFQQFTLPVAMEP
ncbi:MAG: transcriptional regulator [Chloroflexi bacterium]|nr:MAG: transcriptional regulator [Chloroflexota bacterium]